MTTETTDQTDQTDENTADADTSTPTPQTPEFPETTDEPGDGPESRGEAAKYRRRLRDTEAERDALSGNVEALRRQMVDTLTGPVLVDPADLWRHGTELGDLLGDDGTIDATKVTAAVESMVAARPHLAAPRIPRADPSQGARGDVPKGDPWKAAFKAPN